MFRGMSIDNRTARKFTLDLAKDWGFRASKVPQVTKYPNIS
jgi:hypothetical protein